MPCTLYNSVFCGVQFREGDISIPCYMFLRVCDGFTTALFHTCSVVNKVLEQVQERRVKQTPIVQNSVDVIFGQNMGF